MIIFRLPPERNWGRLLPAEDFLVAVVDAFAHLLPSDGIHLFKTFLLKILVEAIVGADGVDGVCHGFNVPIVSLNDFFEDFTAS